MVECVAAFSIVGHCCGGGETHKEHVGDGQKQREDISYDEDTFTALNRAESDCF